MIEILLFMLELLLSEQRMIMETVACFQITLVSRVL